MADEQETVVETLTSDDPIVAKIARIVGAENVSDTELERIVYSGDPSSLPQFHYRWKYKYLVDYVVRVKSIDQVQAIVKIAGDENIPIIPRGGASSCLGSSSPTRGGISLDTKPMNQVIEINSSEMYVRVEAGVTFNQLERELFKHGVTLGIRPTSARSAVIGGWIGCGGEAGIGTPLHGSLVSNILELKVVKPNGESVNVTGDDIGLFCGSYGILGVICEAKLRVVKYPSGHTTFSYAFDLLEHTCNAMRHLSMLEPQPVYLKIADKQFQSYSNPLEKGNYVLTATYQNEPDPCPTDKIEAIMADNGGEYLGADYSLKDWYLVEDCEFNPKEHCQTLMFQEMLVQVDKLYDLLKSYESYKKSHKTPAIWFAMLGHDGWIRAELMAMLDPEKYLKFIGSKGILHKMVGKSVKLGGGPYTIGLQNSVYMKRAFPNRQEKMIVAKDKWDPGGIMNPDRVTSCLTSYLRMNVLFQLAAGIRRLSKIIDRGE
ncbi:MAG: FAD-binding oxidoreductase [Candidatus Thorarchaeota archaeon]|nr:MAG: FAD-binding oxidoreductase [Candidatus Thorarchaeota archaeon]